MNYILPNFYDNFLQNNLIKQQFFTDINIIGLQGNYPFCIFNGSCNNIKVEQIALYRDFIECLNQYGMLGNKILLDFGNINLENNDFHNVFGNLIAETFFDNPSFYFQVSDENFINFLIEKYPNIQLMLHKNYVNFHTEQEVQQIIQKFPNNIKLIAITELNKCINLKDIKKIYVLSLFECQQCKHYHMCIDYDNTATLNYSEQSIFNSCEVSEFKTIQQIYNIINDVKRMGIKTIMFDSIPAFYEEVSYDIIKNIFNWEKDNDLF